MPHRTEAIMSKGMGALRGAKAAIRGLGGVFRKLTEEHGETSALLLRVRRSSDVELRRRLFPILRAELLGHEQGELAEVYPVFMQYRELASYARDHAREAEEIERLLDHLSAMGGGDAAWTHAFDELARLVTHHMKKEEDVYFPAASRVLTKDELRRMLPRYEAAKAEASRLTT
jgi:hypothetical protein